MLDVKIEVETVKIQSEKNIIKFTSAQVGDIVRNYVMRKKKLPNDAEFIFKSSDGSYSVEWKKEAKKSTKTIAGGNGNSNPDDNAPANAPNARKPLSI